MSFQTNSKPNDDHNPEIELIIIPMDNKEM